MKTTNIYIILSYPDFSIPKLKKFLYEKNKENNEFLFINKTLKILEIYDEIKHFLMLRDIELINVYDISLIENYDEKILEKNNSKTNDFSIEDLHYKIENECLNIRGNFVKINKRKSIYINLPENDKDDDIVTINKIILNYNHYVNRLHEIVTSTISRFFNDDDDDVVGSGNDT